MDKGALLAYIGIQDGELAAICKRQRELKRERYPQDIEDRHKWAEATLRAIEHDRQFRTGQMSLEEIQKNRELQMEAEAIVLEKNRIDANYESKKKKLQEERREIEGEIIRWRNRLAYLRGAVTQQTERQANDLRRAASWARYTLQRDQQDIIRRLAELDEQIAKAEGLDKPLAEIARMNFLAREYPAYKSEFERREKEAVRLENQLAGLEANLAGAIKQAQDELLRLDGRPE